MTAELATTRVLTDLRHGGHALSDKLYATQPIAEALEGVTPVSRVLADETVSEATDEISTPFGYLFVDLQTATRQRTCR